VPRSRRALAWLGTFASIGCTPREPLGAALFDSRALGLHGTERGLAFSGDRPFTSEPYPHIPGAMRVTQDYRGYKKYWLQFADGEKLPWRGDVPDDPTPERLEDVARFLESWPPLAEMPFAPEDRGRAVAPWVVKPGPPDGSRYCPDPAHTDRQACPTCVYIGLMDARNLVRDVLASTTDDALPLARAIMEALHAFCVGDAPYVDPMPAVGGPPSPHPESMCVPLQDAPAALARLHVWYWRAPLASRLDEDGRTLWVAGTFPGVVWAELLNLFPLDTTARASLHRCKWCGRFWVDAEAPGAGRPREFCAPECRIRFHDYGPADPRT
jgi:hypothetical protein